MAILFPASLLAQNIVRGTVTEAAGGSAMPGVTVTVQGTARGITTDGSGAYQIQAAPSEVLVFTFLGYATQSITVGSAKIPGDIQAPAGRRRRPGDVV